MSNRHPYLDGPWPRAYAHRGWHLGDLAGCENTMAAFRRAVDEGFGYLELDVHASADGVAFVHHDRLLDRTTDRTGPLDALPAAELDTVRIRGREPVPRLEQVLTELPHTRVTVELKSAAAVTPVLAVLGRTGAWDRVCLGSLEQTRLDRARALGGRRLCMSMGHVCVVGLRSRAWCAMLPGPLAGPAGGLGRRLAVRGDLAQLPRRLGPLTVVDTALLRVAHDSGREVHVWTVDDPAEMVELLDMGVDGLLSDRPDLLRDVLAARGQWPS